MWRTDVEEKKVVVEDQDEKGGGGGRPVVGVQAQEEVKENTVEAHALSLSPLELLPLSPSSSQQQQQPTAMAPPTP